MSILLRLIQKIIIPVNRRQHPHSVRGAGGRARRARGRRGARHAPRARRGGGHGAQRRGHHQGGA